MALQPDAKLDYSAFKTDVPASNPKTKESKTYEKREYGQKDGAQPARELKPYRAIATKAKTSFDH